MICTIRIPDVLQGRIDHAAGDGKRSEWILEACRMRLDNPPPALFGSKLPDNPPRTVAGSHHSKPALQALRDICVGNVRNTPDGPVRPEFRAQPASPDIPLCGKTWWEDGEQYECLMDKGHKIAKCGQRGMVRNITP